jgi:electron transport complex protein RnfC
VRARIGTTIADIVELAGGYTDDARQLVIGGPMTGKSVSTDHVPLVKATNCVMVLCDTSFPETELPCIRCGECAEVCPILLLLQQLHWFSCADDEAMLRNFGLTDCIECGCCDLVCPSHIPLTADFRLAKARMRELADEKSRAERARQRFETRNLRLSADQEQREKELAAQKETARKIGPDAIKAIAERVRKKSPNNPDKD